MQIEDVRFLDDGILKHDDRTAKVPYQHPVRCLQRGGRPLVGG